MTRDPITRAWAALIALSAASTVLARGVSGGALAGPALTAAGAAILILAWAKARTILNVYLGLGRAAALRRGFGLALALYAGLLLALYVMG
ncbi:nitric oxide reductase F protein [Albidovulum sp.]|uniref:nitric oxide reductase F protein n=1 Tax=Albidovulum sp. TaxID=1872424 RepID=UPI001D789083|nr:hypothetical protein [Paracoccaceae bacterium]HPE24761.1 hypothetical protein [Albidovulum sp.]MCB2132692.1 hypothetical protein [Paracoccaceae bacterium]MCO5126062.1 hypothetical protein [Paracoccaceae bacterium]MCP5324221.1 hypothetical protein [Paracoccaceae bacterium]